MDDRLVIKRSGGIVRFNPRVDQTIIKRGLEAIRTSPELIEIQRRSFDQFLQMNVPPPAREEIGLQGVFTSIFPIFDYDDSASLEFVKYEFGAPKCGAEECREKGMTFSAPLRVTLRLVVWDKQAGSESKSIRDIKEQEGYLGEMPLMTGDGTFIISFDEDGPNVTDYPVKSHHHLHDLGGSRLCLVGELMEKFFRIGLSNMRGVVVERMRGQDPESLMPYDLVDIKAQGDAMVGFVGALVSDVESKTPERHDAEKKFFYEQKLTTNPACRYELGSFLLESKSYEEAVKEFRSALSEWNDSTGSKKRLQIHYQLGVALWCSGNKQEAADEFALSLQQGCEEPYATTARKCIGR